MTKILISSNDRQTMKKKDFQYINIGVKYYIKNFEELAKYVNDLDDENYFYTWEII